MFPPDLFTRLSLAFAVGTPVFRPFASPLLAVHRSSSTQKRRRDLACEKLERQMTGALTVRESKPEAQETINQVRLIGVAYPYRAQTNLADQLFYHCLRRTRGAAIKEIAQNSLVEWIGKVLPTIGVKGAIDRVLLHELLEKPGCL